MPLARVCRCFYRPHVSVFLIGLLAFLASAAIGTVQGIAIPQIHDEFSYLLAADTFAHGRLTNPTHPLWVHFETMHVIHVPSYMSKFMPGQGAILAFGQVVGGHPIVGVWLSMALMCASICWMLHAWVPRRWAVMGGILAIIHPIIGVGGYWAQSSWGGAVAATGGALLLGGARRLVREPRARFALVMGIGLTILASSRPYEGLVLSLPIGAAMLLWLAGNSRPTFSVICVRVLMPLGCVGALSLAGLAYYDYRITGDVSELPYWAHEKMYIMSPQFVWQKLPPTPSYRHDIIKNFYSLFELPVYLRKRTFGGFVSQNFAAIMLYGFFGVGVLAIPLIGGFRSWVPWAWKNRWGRLALVTFLIFVTGIFIESNNRLHYWAPVTALTYFFTVQSMRLWRVRDRRVGQLVIFLVPAFSITVFAILFYRSIMPPDALAPHMQRARLIARLNHDEKQHLIIVKYGPRHSFHNEWVFNGADIDGSKIVWARSMSRNQDCKLAGYFKERTIWSLEIDRDHEPFELKPFPTRPCE